MEKEIGLILKLKKGVGILISPLTGTGKTESQKMTKVIPQLDNRIQRSKFISKAFPLLRLLDKTIHIPN